MLKKSLITLCLLSSPILNAGGNSKAPEALVVVNKNTELGRLQKNAFALKHHIANLELQCSIFDTLAHKITSNPTSESQAAQLQNVKKMRDNIVRTAQFLEGLYTFKYATTGENYAKIADFLLEFGINHPQKAIAFVNLLFKKPLTNADGTLLFEAKVGTWIMGDYYRTLNEAIQRVPELMEVQYKSESDLPSLPAYFHQKRKARIVYSNQDDKDANSEIKKD